MSKTLPLVLLLLLSTSSRVFGTDDPVIIYPFQDDPATPNAPLTVCPFVSPSPATPSFRLQPTSTNIGFLTGTYTHSGARASDFTFLNDTRRCEPRSSLVSRSNCSVLSVIYKPTTNPIGLGTLHVTYTPTRGDAQTILVNYGSVGIYVKGSNRIFQRQADSMSELDGTLIAYGQILVPAILCINGTGQQLSATLISTSNVVDSCSQDAAQENERFVYPVQFRIVIDQTILGRHTVYAAAGNNCSSELRSLPFEISLDPVTLPPEVTTEMTFVTPATTPTGKRLSDVEISIIAVVLGVAFVVVVIIITVLVYILIRRRQKKIRGVGSRTSSTSSAETDGGRPSPIMNLIPGQRNDHTRAPSHRKKLYIVKSGDSDPIKRITESLHELNGDLEHTSVPEKNGKLPAFVSKVVKNEDRVIILGDGGELNSSQQDTFLLSTRWIQELELRAAYPREQLRNVFLVLFGISQDLESLQQVSNLPRIPVSQHLDDDNLDAAAIAKIIQDQIEILLSKSQPDRPEGASTPNLSTEWGNSSTDLKRKVNGGATPPTHLRMNQLKDQPGTSSASDMSANSLTHLLSSGLTGIQAEMKQGFEKMIDATKQQGQMTRDTVINEGGKLQEDMEVVHNHMEQMQITFENQHVDVCHPPSDVDHTHEQPPSTNDEYAPQVNNNQELHEGSPLSDFNPSLEDLLSHYGLQKSDLESECPHEIRNKIALKLEDWKLVGRFLNIPSEKLTAIDVDNKTEEERRVILLEMWAKKEGEGATYLKLAEVMHKRERRDLVQMLCAELKKQ